MRGLLGIAIAAVVTAFAPGLPAHAQQSIFANHPGFAADEHPVYVAFGGGWVFANSLNSSASGSLIGIPFDVSADLTFDTGQTVGGVVGYQINQYLAIEGEFGYASLSMKSLKLGLSIPGLGGVGAKIGASGDVDTYIGMVNAIVTPAGVGIVTPYLGGGIGVGHIETSLDALTLGGARLNVNASNDETDLALQAIVGVDLALSERFAIGARYSYLWLNTGRSESGGGCGCLFSFKGKVDDFTANVLMITGTLVF
jgi:opacity protein-like surface antigen